MNERESMNALLRKVRQYFGKRAAAPSPEFVRSTDFAIGPDRNHSRYSSMDILVSRQNSEVRVLEKLIQMAQMFGLSLNNQFTGKLQMNQEGINLEIFDSKNQWTARFILQKNKEGK
jgi:hypothetical protein